MHNGIYLDNCMTTRPSEKALSNMMPFYTDFWGSPSSPHMKGQELFPTLKASYKELYDLLGANEEDTIIFTSSGAEAVNHVLMSAYYDITVSKGKNQFLTSNMDEAPVILTIGRLEQLGCVGKMVDANKRGEVTAQAIADAITPRTAIVSLSWGNGMTGTINPVSEISDLCQERGILFHLDATHVLGKLFFKLEDVGADLISFNGDHLHAPKGTGALYIKNGVKCSPFILGGMEQGGKRAGVLNVPGLVALGTAAREALDNRDFICTEIARLRDRLESGIQKGFPDAIPFFQDQNRLPNCTTIAFPGIANEALLFLLNRNDVYASIGGGDFQQIGLILMACGIDEITAHSAISFSLSRETNDDEIDRAIAIIVECAKKLQKTSEQLYPEIV